MHALHAFTGSSLRAQMGSHTGEACNACTSAVKASANTVLDERIDPSHGGRIMTNHPVAEIYPELDGAIVSTYPTTSTDLSATSTAPAVVLVVKDAEVLLTPQEARDLACLLTITAERTTT